MVPWGTRLYPGTDEREPQNLQRYIRLTNLLPELITMVDEKKMGFSPAVEINFLDEEHQRELLDVMDMEQASPSLSQAQELKSYYQINQLDKFMLERIMERQKPNQKENIKINYERLNKYIPKGYSLKQTEDLIVELLKK